MSSILWLASYPRSGNTWLRVLLHNYKRNLDTPIHINEPDGIIGSGNRWQFDNALGIDSGDLSFDEVDSYRQAVYRHYAQISDGMVILKIHDAFTYLANGCPMLPLDVTHGALYIIRNPLDVAISFASYNMASISDTINWMCDDRFTLCGNRYSQQAQLRQQLLSWSSHAKSWLTAPNLSVNLIRYEDLVDKPLETFRQVLEFIGVAVEDGRLQRAIEHSRFEVIQKQEEKSGFGEKPTGVTRFFRQGKAGSWKEVLTKEQVEQIIEAHYETMHHFGYIGTDSEIAY